MTDIFKLNKKVIVLIDNLEQLPISNIDHSTFDLTEFESFNGKIALITVGPHQPKTKDYYITYRYINNDFICVPNEFRWYK